MHRIDTPTAQADKFGQGKNGFTNGEPATGRRATDLNSDMWDAVQEEICNAIEKSGAVLNKGQHDQLYQAIVTLITDRVPDALLRSQNLADVVDKALARTNLELERRQHVTQLITATIMLWYRLVTRGILQPTRITARLILRLTPLSSVNHCLLIHVGVPTPRHS